MNPPITICHCCATEANTKYVEFHQNIGALVLRFSKSMKGHLCKDCIKKYFWEFTLVNITVGWLGLISLIIAPIYTVMNIFHFLSSRGLEPVPATSKRPVLTQTAINALQPYAQHMIQRLKGREQVETIASDLEPRCGVTPGQVALYMRAMIAGAKK